MSISSAQKIAELVLSKGIPGKFKCSSIIEDLINELPEIFNVQVPGSPLARYLYVGASAPGPVAHGSLWLELNGAGVPKSVNYWLDGTWNQLINFLQTPQWREGSYLGDRTTLDRTGFVLADGTNGGTDLRHLFKRIPGSTPQDYSVYAVYYVGVQIVREE